MRHWRRRASACGSRLTPCARRRILRCASVALRRVQVSCVAGARPSFRLRNRSFARPLPRRIRSAPLHCTLARSQRVRPWAIGRTRETARSSERLTTLRAVRLGGLSRKSAHSHCVHSPFGSLLRSLVRQSVRPRGAGEPTVARCLVFDSSRRSLGNFAEERRSTGSSFFARQSRANFSLRATVALTVATAIRRLRRLIGLKGIEPFRPMVASLVTTAQESRRITADRSRSSRFP